MPRKKPSPQPDYSSFGQRLAELRKAAGLSQRAFAREVGISHRMVVYYETRAVKPPFQVLPKMAETLGVSVEALLGLGAEKPKRSAPAPINRRLLAKMKQLQDLPKRDQQALMRTIDAFLSKSSAA